MLLNLASCLAIPAAVLDGQSLQEFGMASSFRAQGSSPPVDFHHFFSPPAFMNRIPSVL